jgi:pimeloyl-ACP methyl ester carboxylesterase
MDLALARTMFAGDMTDQQWALASTSIVDEAVGLFRDSLPGYSTGVPTTYVAMTDDVPVPPASAAEMIKQLGADVDYREIEAAHNVMLSQPETLAKLLNDLAATA